MIPDERINPNLNTLTSHASLPSAPAHKEVLGNENSDPNCSWRADSHLSCLQMGTFTSFKTKEWLEAKIKNENSMF